ncbi:hypothetical protein U0070_014932, partial [Myodes glareolus]
SIWSAKAAPACRRSGTPTQAYWLPLSWETSKEPCDDLEDRTSSLPEVMKGTLTKILNYTLLPNENGKVRTGASLSLVRALGYEKSVLSVNK